MFGFVYCNASILARQTTDPTLFFVRTLVKNWLWPIITFFGYWLKTKTGRGFSETRIPLGLYKKYLLFLINLGVTGNILAIIVLTKRRMIMSSTNNYLAALALVDIAYLILTLILNTSQHPCFTGTTLSNILLVICRPIADFSSNTSVWITVTFTVERWVAITYPLQSRTWCTVHRARKIIISVMCAALICTSPSAFEMKLVRIYETKNSTNTNKKPSFTSRIRAKPTALGNSLLYHQIYFNFVTFAIIWIPLLFLVIFNTILSVYVHRSKQDEHRNSDGIQLRKHNRGNQGEQRKTTIMLIAVVIVFTVCQIPQAISLTVQSFFPILAQTSKVLIYNNFANCLVALNASMNFLLYCCFSDRFRSTFRSSFAFLHKYCANYIQPNWKYTSDNAKYSVSLDNMSCTYPCTPSNYSLQGQPLNARISNTSNDLSQKGTRKTFSNTSQISNLNQQLWTPILSKFKFNKNDENDFKQILVSQSTETRPNSPTTSIMKSPTSFVRQSPSSNILTADYSISRSSIQEPIPSRSSAIAFTTKAIHLKSQSSSMGTLNRPFYKNCSKENFKKITNITPNRSNYPSTLHPLYHSHRSLHDNSTEQIWIKRRLSNDTIHKLFDRRKSFLWKEIVDVTV